MIDPYIYEGTDVLINKLNIKDNQTLQNAEKEFTTVRMKQIFDDEENKLINGSYDYEHLMTFHKFIFQDVYEWAGKQRTIDIEKSEISLNGIDFKYSPVECIHNEISKSLDELSKTNWQKVNLEERVNKFTYLLSDIWRAHAFREGNTRTTIMFFIKAAEKLGIPLKHEILTENSDYLRRALVASSYEDKEIGISRNFIYLNRIIKDSFESKEHELSQRKTLEEIKNDVNSKKANTIIENNLIKNKKDFER